MLYFTAPGLTYFITVMLDLLTIFIQVTHPTLPTSGNYYSDLCIYEPSFLDSTYMRYYIIFAFLTYITQHYTLKVHPRCCKSQGFLPFMSKKHSTAYIYMPHFLYPFIYLWTLGGFYALTMVNNVAMGIGMQMCLSNSDFVPSDTYPAMEFLDHMVALLLIF